MGGEAQRAGSASRTIVLARPGMIAFPPAQWDAVGHLRGERGMDEAEFAARVEAADVPGAVVALARGRGPVSVFVAGVRDRKTRVPVDEQTVFQADRKSVV